MKVYVGNLPFSVDDEKLREFFSSFGRSKGFGFVTFANKEDAEKAIAKMSDKEVEGRTLKVNEAKPIDPDRPRPPRRDFGGRGGGGGRRDFGGGQSRRRF